MGPQGISNRSHRSESPCGFSFARPVNELTDSGLTQTFRMRFWRWYAMTDETADEMKITEQQGLTNNATTKRKPWCLPAGSISLWTVSRVQHGKHIRVIKRFFIKQPNGTWMSLARHTWLAANGPNSIPEGYDVAYIVAPPDVPLDIDYTGNDISNLKLVSSKISHNLERSPKHEKKRRKRHRQAIPEANRRRWDVWNSSRLRESHRVWYPLDTVGKVIWMRPRATRKAAIEETLKAGRPCDTAVRGSELKSVVTADWTRSALWDYPGDDEGREDNGNNNTTTTIEQIEQEE